MLDPIVAIYLTNGSMMTGSLLVLHFIILATSLTCRRVVNQLKCNKNLLFKY